MTGPRGSTHSILRCYHGSYPRIVSFEECDYAHRSTRYANSFREVVVTCPLLVSNREIAKITVHADRGGALYCGNVSADAEAQLVPGEGEGTYSDSWLRDDV